MKRHENYVWKAGKPYGIGNCTGQGVESSIHYKIVADPYYKRISVEKYNQDGFSSIAYDSALFDFRKLKPEEQNAWQKSQIIETPLKTICHIRDQDDRLILIEEYSFYQEFCRTCHSFSPHGILVSIQKIFYTCLGDPFDGTILYDCNEHPVMYKKYRTNPVTNEFSELIEEEWDMSKNTIAPTTNSN